jgi:hypothetical protein
MLVEVGFPRLRGRAPKRSFSWHVHGSDLPAEDGIYPGRQKLCYLLTTAASL